MVDYNMPEMKIIVGDLENAVAINSIILHTKKAIYKAMKKEQKTHIINVKYEVKLFYYQEKYRHKIKGKKKRNTTSYVIYKKRRSKPHNFFEIIFLLSRYHLVSYLSCTRGNTVFTDMFENEQKKTI